LELLDWKGALSLSSVRSLAEPLFLCGGRPRSYFCLWLAKRSVCWLESSGFVLISLNCQTVRIPQRLFPACLSRPWLDRPLPAWFWALNRRCRQGWRHTVLARVIFPKPNEGTSCSKETVGVVNLCVDRVACTSGYTLADETSSCL